MTFVRKLFATVLFSGYAPFASGTVGTVATIPFVLLLWWIGNDWVHGAAILVTTMIGLWAASTAEADYGRKDPGQVVIDESAGYFVATWLVAPTVGTLLASFFLFRFFDVAKIWPASRLEKIEGARGIMFDDLAAGAYANVVLQLALYASDGRLAFGRLF